MLKKQIMSRKYQNHEMESVIGHQIPTYLVVTVFVCYRRRKNDYENLIIYSKNIYNTDSKALG